jgi:hypothetical protein
MIPPVCSLGKTGITRMNSLTCWRSIALNGNIKHNENHGFPRGRLPPQSTQPNLHVPKAWPRLAMRIGSVLRDHGLGAKPTSHRPHRGRRVFEQGNWSVNEEVLDSDPCNPIIAACGFRKDSPQGPAMCYCLPRAHPLTSVSGLQPNRVGWGRGN